jgi:hypothetical protein
MRILELENRRTGNRTVALRGDEPPIVVIGKLKLSFSLDLVLQAVDRTAACDEVWLAVGAASRRRLCDPRVGASPIESDAGTMFFACR